MKNLITRSEACVMLGLTRSGFNAPHVRAHLREHRSKEGWLQFDRDEVEALVERRANAGSSSLGGRPMKSVKRSHHAAAMGGFSEYSVEESERVFRALEKGVSPVAAALDCRVHPRAMRAIASDYADLKDSLLLSGSTMRALERLPIEGNLPFRTERDLLDALTAALEAKPCVKCKVGERAVCKQCAAPPKVNAAGAQANGVNADAKRKAG